MSFQLQSAYLLHSRPYRDSSLIVDLLTEDFGRCRAVARGGRKPTKRSGLPLQLCQPLLVSCTGKNELQTLSHVETNGPAIALAYERLYSAMYLNELLVRLLAPQDSCPEIYQLYHQTLTELAGGAGLESVLRQFEYQLLQELGYGIDLTHTHENTPVISEEKYRFSPDFGLQMVLPGEHRGGEFLGADLLAMAADDFTKASTRAAGKKLMRSALSVLLGERPLKSRELFIKK